MIHPPGIRKLSIRRFKSIESLDLECRRVNLFLGEPNTGKSNLVEALGFLSALGQRGSKLEEFVRFASLDNLFLDNVVDQPIEIVVNGEREVSLRYAADRFNLKVVVPTDRSHETSLGALDYSASQWTDMTLQPRSGAISYFERFKFFRYRPFAAYPEKGADGLKPPFGANLFSQVFSRKEFKDWFKEFFAGLDYKVNFKPADGAFEILREEDGAIVTHSWAMLSDTLLRHVFFQVAIRSNPGKTIVLEEPESHAFPYYAKILAETIGLTETTQFFVVTHNPYIAMSIVEKTGVDQLAVHVVKRENYRTVVKRVPAERVALMYDDDPFFNLDLLTGDEP